MFEPHENYKQNEMLTRVAKYYSNFEVLKMATSVNAQLLSMSGKECSFEAILKKYDMTNDPALVLLGKIVNGADTDNTLWNQPEGPGLEAIAEGFRHLGFKDDREQNAAEWNVYDALYAYCQEMVRQALSQMDVPTRQAYTMALVEPSERTAAASVTSLARSVGSSASPVFSGLLLQGPLLVLGLSFILAGALKVAYDLTLWSIFRRVHLREATP